MKETFTNIPPKHNKFNILSTETINLNQETKEVVKNTLQSLNSYISSINLNINTINNLYKSNNILHAEYKLSSTVEMIDLFIQLTSSIYNTSKINFKKTYSLSEDIHKLKIELYSLIKAIGSERQNKNFIMLCDLLECNVKDNLTQWKIKTIPALKEIWK